MIDRNNRIQWVHLMIALALTLPFFGLAADAGDAPTDAGYKARQQWVLDMFKDFDKGLSY